jgi:hypothetical protein
MEMKFFGKPWVSPFCETTEHVETPVGAVCIHCDELIEEGDTGVIYANGPVAHRDCFLRGVFGSRAHIEKRCSCFVDGATETDPPDLTKREAAKEVAQIVLGEDY